MADIQDASFRDPDGFLFERDGILYRQINRGYRETFEALEQSGLLRDLIDRGLLVSHRDIDEPGITADADRVIQPQRLPVISYPYEWSFSQLKDAALLTLQIQELALDAGFSLKDASAYNIQFFEGRPLFIDTLSFEPLPEDRPWVAYRQFCQHFLAPLALMANTDIALQQLLRSNIDGIPLDLASKLLPLKTRFRFSLLVHIHLHARSQARHADKAITRKAKFSTHAFRALLDNLKSTIAKLQWRAEGTEWGNYYEANHNYEADNLEIKSAMVEQHVAQVAPQRVWDLGANTGRFSAVAAAHSQSVCAWDIDPACVEQHYLDLKKAGSTNIYPLLLDLANPSPAIGWANRERMSLRERGGVDLVLALGLVHHLAISNNLPLDRVAAFLADMGSNLVIEFVPKSDSQVQRLLRNREDIFVDYHREGFEQSFSACFDILSAEEIGDSGRILYRLSAR